MWCLPFLFIPGRGSMLEFPLGRISSLGFFSRSKNPSTEVLHGSLETLEEPWCFLNKNQEGLRPKTSQNTYSYLIRKSFPQITPSDESDKTSDHLSHHPEPNLQSHLVCAGITFGWTTTRHGSLPFVTCWICTVDDFCGFCWSQKAALPMFPQLEKNTIFKSEPVSSEKLKVQKHRVLIVARSSQLLKLLKA